MGASMHVLDAKTRDAGESLVEALETKRLRLRRWRARDEAPFAAMNADAKVMAYYPALLNPSQAREAIETFKRHFATYGFGFWAVELKDTLEFVGCIGLEPYQLQGPIGGVVIPCVAIGWQLVSKFWGRGLALEAAQAVIEDATHRLRLKELVAVTHEANLRSVRLCERLGMQCDGARTVNGHAWPASHPLRRQLVFRRQLG